MRESEIRDVLLVRQKNRVAEKREAVKQRIKKKIQTAFIGAIAKFEEFFGEFWGHKENFGSLTEEQIEMRKMWEQCRNEILNNGNNQIRGMESEMDSYYGYNFERVK